MLTSGNVKILHGVSDDGLIDLYRRAEVLVSLSVYEGFGIPLLEGLFYGCKDLCSDIPVYRELFSGHAHFCDPYSIPQISNALSAVVASTSNDPAGSDALFDKFSYHRSAKIIVNKIIADNA